MGLLKLKFEIVRHAHIAWYRIVMCLIAVRKKVLQYECNICGGLVASPLVDVCEREKISCPKCGANLRHRSVVHALSLELFGRSLILPDWPVSMQLHGIGTSDWEGVADRLAKKCAYVNTYYHQEPRLDLGSIPESKVETCDFLVSCDVMEHVAPPVAIGFRNLYRLLKRGGVCVMTVPYMHYDQTWEHYPELFDYKVSQVDGRQVLENRTRNGRIEIFSNPVFHGGDGSTLELRVFSRKSLEEELKRAGFHEIRFHRIHQPAFGIIWPINWSLVISARKGIFSN